MSLTLRPTGLSSPVDRERLDYTVFSGGWAIARIYEDRGALPALRWFWALYGPHAGPPVMRKDGRARSLDAAKTQFADNWRKWLAWAGLQEVSDISALGNVPTKSAPSPLRPPPV
jgi:hypothetical protein